MSERTRKRAAAVLSELLLAVHSGREDEVRRLLALGADVSGADTEGMTPLMASAMNGHLSIVRLLLEAGASREAANTWGMTARDIAVWHGHDAIAALLSETADGKGAGPACRNGTETEA